MNFDKLVDEVISERDYGKYKRTEFMHRLRIFFTFNKIFNKLSYDGQTILDVGCNEGTYSVLFRAKGFDIDGLDVCDLRKAKQLSDKYNLKVKYYSTSIENANYSKNYDYIFCSEVLEHVNNFNQAIVSIKNHSHKNTKIILSLPNVFSLFGLLNLVKDIVCSRKIDSHQKFPPWRVKKLFDEYGFNIKVLGSVNFLPFNLFYNINLILSTLGIFKILGYSTFYYATCQKINYSGS
jgi:2-polyprenyl-3-methyl-5-hydroxy-6-metoxy-1,4-benzoquinol methylase|tara:strand:+ start:1354 stop:2061 length:708 start_codon:yes stop_codon:yes gene_type:complete